MRYLGPSFWIVKLKIKIEDYESAIEECLEILKSIPKEKTRDQDSLDMYLIEIYLSMPQNKENKELVELYMSAYFFSNR